MSNKVQLIKQEIERGIEQCYRALSQDLLERERNETNCCLQQYKEILQFIDSLPEEPACEANCTAKSKDLKEELNSWMGENCDDNGFFDPLELAYHFVEWQKEKHNKQFGFLNLKDCKDAYNEWKSTQDEPSAALAWVRACEWQRNQIAKDSVEADAFNTKN